MLPQHFPQGSSGSLLSSKPSTVSLLSFLLAIFSYILYISICICSFFVVCFCAFMGFVSQNDQWSQKLVVLQNQPYERFSGMFKNSHSKLLQFQDISGSCVLIMPILHYKDYGVIHFSKIYFLLYLQICSGSLS